MKIYFNQVPDNNIQFFNDKAEFGPHTSDNYFYNCVEFGTNAGGIHDVAIADSCGRMIPINMEAVPELIQALEKTYELWSKIILADKINMIVENSSVEMYVEDNQIAVDAESFQDAISDTE